ncbi:MAG: orotidine-5'-phosphate decarboxylase [Desulfovibrio sp.]|jgi:orotidine-5'-phosphate decarboxylase|nr:orotidine-5'-phosphate decarboxylase [Desulfovibrio sp.]
MRIDARDMVSPRLYIALDVASESEALSLASRLWQVKGQDGLPRCGFKVGFELFTAAGPGLIRRLADEGSVFLDLKFHDIPNTVYGAVRAACRLGAGMLTLHLAGGEEMCRQALMAREEAWAGLEKRGDGSAPEKPRLLGVSVLTSTGGDARAIKDLVLDYARAAKAYGLDGLVCSGHEAGEVKEICGADFLCICPGIRFAGGEENDQARVCTPLEAMLHGADFLVMGRPVIQACDPVQAAVAALQDMEKGLRMRK